jgi:hypothetical protein
MKIDFFSLNHFSNLFHLWFNESFCYTHNFTSSTSAERLVVGVMLLSVVWISLGQHWGEHFLVFKPVVSDETESHVAEEATQHERV